ncbi:phosphatase PAP2 family protein [Actinoplanes awajinensis]|uniref:Phosphatidic acid phosphatase type 2/haloperoxidase domain-containing protein n=1 Tax=Actinoplanes awajinensis subsp. mycoplanecinus TaxID=135947 RepID=A0A101JCQ8_9ACTN|nr:phosphatase PAP2 family protein [Actinoplanes awajinensis]KUL24373.1 hypothetical protein ADL15_43495 [Actinoplanes awajinensis subsp. mycoplanecinus]
MTVQTRDHLAFASTVVGLSAAAFVLLAMAVAGRAGPLISFDTVVSAHAHAVALAHPLWRSVMLAVTATGSTVVVAPLGALGCLILLATGRWRQAVFAAAALTVVPLARLAVLALVARPRPVDQLAPAANYSFPSGHSTTSATAALVLVLVCWPLLRRRGRVLLAVLAGAWAVAVGVSRVALVVHWPTDVAGAWLFTVAMVLTVGLVVRRTLGPADQRGLISSPGS